MTGIIFWLSLWSFFSIGSGLEGILLSFGFGGLDEDDVATIWLSFSSLDYHYGFSHGNIFGFLVVFRRNKFGVEGVEDVGVIASFENRFCWHLLCQRLVFGKASMSSIDPCSEPRKGLWGVWGLVNSAANWPPNLVELIKKTTKPLINYQTARPGVIFFKNYKRGKEGSNKPWRILGRSFRVWALGWQHYFSPI